MRLFLAGASGVIGPPLILRLLGDGHEVIAMTRSLDKSARLEELGAEPVFMPTQVRGASNEKAKREPGWTPRHRTWRDGFREALG